MESLCRPCGARCFTGARTVKDALGFSVRSRDRSCRARPRPIYPQQSTAIKDSGSNHLRSSVKEICLTSDSALHTFAALWRVMIHRAGQVGGRPMTRSAAERTPLRAVPQQSPVNPPPDVGLTGQQLALIDISGGRGTGGNEGLDLPEQIALLERELRYYRR